MIRPEITRLIFIYVVGVLIGVLAGMDYQKQKHLRGETSLFLNYLADHPDLCPYLGSEDCADYGLTMAKCHNKRKHEKCKTFVKLTKEIEGNNENEM